MERAKDYYTILRVDRKADGDILKKAYRERALECHPDRNDRPGAEDEFKRINEAYGVLSDPQKRAFYDLHGKAPRGFEPSAHESPFRQWSPMGFGGCRGGGMGRGCGRRWRSYARTHRMFPEGNDIVCRMYFSAEELKSGTRRTAYIRESSGVVRQCICSIPAGTKRGTRFTVASGATDTGGDVILEIA